MKKLAKRIAALAMTAAMMTASAGAITQDGQSETWFDGVWALIDAFGLKAEHDPYVLQNYINKYLEKHPDEMYDVLNDILSLLDTHSMYLSSEEYSQGFSTLEGFVGIGVGLQETENGVQIAEVMRYSAAEEAGLQIGDLIVKINGEDATKLKNADVASKLRGEEGTSVKLTVRRYGRDITVRSTACTFPTRRWRTVWSTSRSAPSARRTTGRRFRRFGTACRPRTPVRSFSTCAATAAA